MYLCKKCLSVHKEYDIEFSYSSGDSVDEIYESGSCPRKDCTGKVVMVDELILPTVIELNKKGWNTRFCCSGHLYADGGIISTYISFENNPPYAPENFELRHSGIYYKTHKFNSSNRPNNLKRYKQLYEINLELYKWALELPVSTN